MILKKTKIEGVFLIELEMNKDDRGYFTRNFCQKELKQQGVNFQIVQVNRSLTVKKGMIRGLHFQKAPYKEDKIIQCLKGSIFDVAVDLRKDSLTFGQWIGEILSEENKRMLLVSKGLAHGFQALEENTEIQYFVSQYYTPTSESGVRWDDPDLNIKWPIKKVVLSEKDKNLPFIHSFK